jgi:hypothetical protein
MRSAKSLQAALRAFGEGVVNVAKQQGIIGESASAELYAHFKLGFAVLPQKLGQDIRQCNVATTSL